MIDDLTVGLVLLALSGAVGWGISIHTKVTQMQTIIEKLDQLISLMLEDRLAAPNTGSQDQTVAIGFNYPRVPDEDRAGGEDSPGATEVVRSRPHSSREDRHEL